MTACIYYGKSLRHVLDSAYKQGEIVPYIHRFVKRDEGKYEAVNSCCDYFTANKFIAKDFKLLYELKVIRSIGKL